MRKKLLFVIMIVSILITGCIQEGIKDNQVYVVEDDNKSQNQKEKFQNKVNTEGTVPFKEYENFQLMDQENTEKILLTISPDGKNLYFMEPLVSEEKELVIKGDPRIKVRLIYINRDTKEQRLIAENIPFISRVKWNEEGNIVAFSGGERLILYDTEKNKLLLEEKLKNERVTYFFWSPKGENKIYTEHPNLANGSIYYINSRKKVEAYETKEDIYYKGQLDNDYYYATKWYVALEENRKAKNDSINTIILDKYGNVIKNLGEGIFRDAYRKSIVMVGEGGFGLYYIKDINKPEERQRLTHEYVFDVKFVDDGKVAFIVENKDITKNTFFLYVFNKNGKQLKKMEVSGCTLSLLPNGQTGYIGGPLVEKVDFQENKLVGSLFEIDNLNIHEEKEKVLTTLRGAMDTLYKFEMTGEKDWDSLKNFFIDTSHQWAYFDIFNKFKETPDTMNSENDVLYRLNIVVNKFKELNDGKNISVGLRVRAENSSGGGVVADHALELIKIENKWLVTGFSTFPNSPLRAELLKTIEKIIKEAQKGKIFSGALTGKKIKIGQVQFWRSSMPHLSPDIKYANLCKVYLIVNQGGKEVIYKMILDKKNQNYWKPLKISNEKLSYL